MRNCSRLPVYMSILTITTVIFSTAVHAIVPNKLRTELDRFLTDPIKSDQLKTTDVIGIQHFYSERHYQPAWIHTESGQPTTSIHSALSFIATADDHGLDRRDYQYDELMRLITTHSPEHAYTLEFQATWSLLQFMHDLYGGRYAALQLDTDWHIPPPHFDAVAFLQNALDTESLQQSLDKLVTDTPSYNLLMQALNKFRQLVSQQVVWTKIPRTPLLRPGDSHPAIALIRERIEQAYETHGNTAYKLTSSSANEANDYYSSALAHAIKTFQQQHGLNADAIIGPNTIRAMNRTPAEKFQQLRINLERLRWLPRNLGWRYLLVNIAGFQLVAVENGRYQFDMRIIVGREYRATPSFSSRITHMILNPYWNVPASIARKDLLPKQQRDPNYFNDQHIRVFQDYTYSSNPIDTDTVNWHAIKRGFPFALRQEPGAHNALGTIKFMLPNDYSIYLHDTPSKSLFDKDIRTFSSGCIRLEAPLQLAEFALNGHISADELQSQIESGATRQINLPEPLPVYLAYLTVWVNSQGAIHYSPDTYERDRRALHLMHK